MPGELQEAIQPVARNVKRLRTQNELSLSALARAAEISKSTLFKLERGEGNPSIDTLWSLARALGVPFATLFLDDATATIDVLRYDDAPLLAEDGRQRPAADGAFVVRHLLSRRARGELEVYWLDLGPRATRDAAPHSPGVIEHVLVVHGVVEVGVEGQMTRLEPGDRMSFRADRRHGYRSLAKASRLVSVLDYP